MFADQFVIDRAMKAVRDGKGAAGGRDREIVADLVAAYETACDLTRGPDKSRSMHWSVEARSLETRLAAIGNGQSVQQQNRLAFASRPRGEYHDQDDCEAA